MRSQWNMSKEDLMFTMTWNAHFMPTFALCRNQIPIAHYVMYARFLM